MLRALPWNGHQHATHNLTEVVDGMVHLVDNPDCTVEDLMGCQGTRLPTGGVIHGIEGEGRLSNGQAVVMAVPSLKRPKPAGK